MKSEAERNAVLVLNYLQDAHPTAGRKLLIDLLTTSDKEGTDSYWDETSWKSQILAGSATKELAVPQPKKGSVPAASKSDADQKAVFVLNYLKESHPTAGRKLLIDLLTISETKGDGKQWEFESWKNQVLTAAAKKDIEGKFVPKKNGSSPKIAPKVVPAVAAAPKEVNPLEVAAPKRGRPMVASDSSSDDEEDAPPVKKARKEVSPVRKPATPKVAAKVSPKRVFAKKVVVDSSDSSDDEAPAAPVAKRSPKVAAKKAAADSDSSDDEPIRKSAPVAVAAPAAAGGAKYYPPPPANFKPRTSRVDIESVTFHNERLKDNTPGMEATDFLQNRKMMAVKGKDFNKHKQKNKSKLYAAGVDTTIRSFKFDEDE